MTQFASSQNFLFASHEPSYVWKCVFTYEDHNITFKYYMFVYLPHCMFRPTNAAVIPRRDKITGEWRRLHNEELNDLYSSPNIVRGIKSRRMRWAGHVARMGEERGVYRVLVGKSEGRRPLGRRRRRWVGNIRMDLQEVGCEYMD